MSKKMLVVLKCLCSTVSVNHMHFIYGEHVKPGYMFGVDLRCSDVKPL